MPNCHVIYSLHAKKAGLLYKLHPMKCMNREAAGEPRCAVKLQSRGKNDGGSGRYIKYCLLLGTCITLEQPDYWVLFLGSLQSVLKSMWHLLHVFITFILGLTSRNSSNVNLPSLFLSIWLNILSVLFSGVASSAGSCTSDPICGDKAGKS